jgi:hypothetical protein
MKEKETTKMGIGIRQWIKDEVANFVENIEDPGEEQTMGLACAKRYGFADWPLLKAALQLLARESE